MIHPTFREIGKMITFEEMPFEDYIELPAANSHSLMEMHRSPAHYLEARQNPKEPTAAMRLGSQVHMRVFEPERFGRLMRVEPEFTGLTKDGRESAQSKEAKEKRQAWRDSLPLDAEIVTQEELDKVNAIANAVHNHPIGQSLFSMPGHNEYVLVYQDDITGLDCKVRFDRVIKEENGVLVFDLKTTSDASYRPFSRDAYDLMYDLQGGHYVLGGKKFFGPETELILGAAESQPPYAVKFYVADEFFLENGFKRRDKALGRLAECIAKQEFPHYDEKIRNLGLPPRASYEEGDN